jgi:hypothetical protein
MYLYTHLNLPAFCFWASHAQELQKTSKNAIKNPKEKKRHALYTFMIYARSPRPNFFYFFVKRGFCGVFELPLLRNEKRTQTPRIVHERKQAEVNKSCSTKYQGNLLHLVAICQIYAASIFFFLQPPRSAPGTRTQSPELSPMSGGCSAAGISGPAQRLLPHVQRARQWWLKFP